MRIEHVAMYVNDFVTPSFKIIVEWIDLEI